MTWCWATQLGPLWEENVPKAAREKQIGTLVCPDCNGTLARLVESQDGIGLTAFEKAASPNFPGSATIGFALYAVVTDTRPADDAVAILHCWKGCLHHYQINGTMCRALRDRYTATGKKQRVLALPVE